jgi:hypothetical protein
MLFSKHRISYKFNKNQMKKISIISTIIAVILIVVAGGFWYGRNRKEQTVTDNQQIDQEQNKQEKLEQEKNKQFEFKDVALPNISLNYKIISKTIKEEIVGPSDSCRIGYASVGADCGPAFKQYSFDLKNSSKKTTSEINTLVLRVYPFEEYIEYLKNSNRDPFLLENLSGFKNSLRQKISAEEIARKVFPASNAAGGPLAHFKYLDFDEGLGVRAVYHYTQAYEPPSNGEFLYSFQGLTNDSKYYISLKTSLFSPKLEKFYKENEEPVPYYSADADDPQAKIYSEYIKKAFNIIESENEYDYQPSLLNLDDVIKSLKIEGSASR